MSKTESVDLESYFSGFQFELDGTNDDFDELSTPQTEAERVIRSGDGNTEPRSRSAPPSTRESASA
ncbi:hypothetical protein C9J85_03915 [Haloferax sp. wsp5]|nr:hypothetical protein C9J85_03915 [Haloferax sp. wsp5]